MNENQVTYMPNQRIPQYCLDSCVQVCAVVVGYDHHFNQMKLMKACSYLQRLNCHFIATNEDSCLPTTTHIRFPGECALAFFFHFNPRQVLGVW